MKIQAYKCLKIVALSFFFMTTFLRLNAQEITDDILIDSLLDVVLFDDESFVDDMLQEDYKYNLIYTSVTYNNNTFYSGRRGEIDQLNISPQISYSNSKGISASVSGVYYSEAAPNWSYTNLSLGYFSYLGKDEWFRYYLGYTHTIFTDGWDELRNSIDVIVGVRNRNRTMGLKGSVYYMFGSGQSYQATAKAYGNVNLLSRKKYSIRHKPNLNLIFGQQTVFTETETDFTETVYNGLMNTQLNFPLYITTDSWDFEVGYTLNFPYSLETGEVSDPTGLFTFSVGYLLIGGE